MPMPGREARTRRCAAKIARRIGGGKVVDDPDLLEKYGADESGAPPRPPAAVVFPASATDVAASLRAAAGAGVAVTPRGGGTGKSGGAVPVEGGLVLSLERMNAVDEISRDDFVAVVQPGLVLQAFHEAVEKEGLFYPPDPASLDSCSLGGNVAENAGGPRAFKYGVTAHYVLALELATMDGRCLRAGSRTIKNASGYGIVPLLVGSEGTLAVFTRIVLRLLPLPGATAACAALFGSTAEAAGGVGALLRSGMVPRVMELVDRRCMTLMEEGGQVHFDPGAGCAVLIELDGDAAGVEEDLGRAGDLLEKQGAAVLVLTGAVERARFWEARRKISETLKKRYPGKISDDICVPRGRMAEALSAIEAVAKRHGLLSAVYGHAGDGNLHVNLMSEGKAPRREASARDEIMRMVIAMDGAVSGEHGIGSLKRKYLAWQHGRPLVGIEKGIKKLWDPRGLLNPGKIF